MRLVRAPRRSRRRRLAMVATAALLGGLALAEIAPPPVASQQLAPNPAGAGGLSQQGRRLFVSGCSSCHGFQAQGVSGQGPSLHGAGAAAADFYLRTGRMPLDNPGQEPLSAQPRYSDAEIRALDAYIGSFGGPPIPAVDPAAGSQAEGLKLFTSSCSGCHAITAKGGVAVGAFAPPLGGVTPTEVGEAIRVGPFVMPDFPKAQISDSQVNSIASYVQLTQHPDDRGGWGIGHIGPVPEGLIAWLLALVSILIVARLLGERTA